MLVADIDGTLVPGDKRVPPGVPPAVAAAQAAGVRVCLATGRQPRSARRFVDAIRADPPTIVYNGGLLYDFRAGRALWSRPLPLADARRVLPVLREFPQVSPLLFARNTVYAERRTAFVDLYAQRDQNPVEIVPDFAALLTEPPMKYLIVGDRPDLDRLSAAAPRTRCSPSRTTWRSCRRGSTRASPCARWRTQPACRFRRSWPWGTR
jgi:hydroxymethylpyrimidine pyrophosphatase-like HAD family hydrolase